METEPHPGLFRVVAAVAASHNGLSQGPVEIASGFAVDVPSGSLWAVLV
jgi:hypothetical protein